MSDDLLKRLREMRPDPCSIAGWLNVPVNPDGEEAAARIEALEAKVKEDVMEILADMNNLRRTDNGALVRTSCILPSGSLLNVSVQPAIDGWIVCDEGAVVADAMAHGFDVDFSIKGLTSRLSREGLRVEKGRIYSERVSSGELPYMIAYLATAAIEASKWLVNSAAKHSKSGVMDLPKGEAKKKAPDAEERRGQGK